MRGCTWRVANGENHSGSIECHGKKTVRIKWIALIQILYDVVTSHHESKRCQQIIFDQNWWYTIYSWPCTTVIVTWITTCRCLPRETTLPQVHSLVHLQAHPVVYFIICQCDMILVDGIPIRLFRLKQYFELDISTHHFFNCIFVWSVPVCAAISFFKSPTVSSGLHLTRTKCLWRLFRSDWGGYNRVYLCGLNDRSR